MTGAAFEHSLKRLREETDALLVEGLTRMIVMILITVGLFAFGDTVIHRDHLLALFVHKLILVLVGSGVIVLLTLPPTRRWAPFLGLLFLVATVVSCAVQGALTGDGVTPAPLFMVFMIGTACFLPWGVFPQAVLAFTAALSVIGNDYAVAGHAVGAIGAPLLVAALGTFAASVYLAHFFERQRSAYSQQGIQLATDAARAGDERLSGVNDGLWDWSLESGDVYYSTRWKEILGYNTNEITPRFDEWRRRIHPDDAPTFEVELLACIRGERLRFENEHRVRRKDGSDCWVLARGLVSRNPEGQAVRMAGSLTDIAERKRIEAALRESESKYRDMIENLNDVVFAVDADARYTYLSPAIEAVAGYAADELLGRSQFELIHPDDVAQVVDAFNRAIGAGVHEAGEFRMRAKSGSWLWVRSNGRRIEIDGTAVGLRGTLTDITDRKQAEVERAAVLELSRDIGGTLDVGEILDRLHPRVAAALQCDCVFTFRWDRTRKTFTVAGQYGCPPELLAECMALEYPSDDPFVQQLGSAGTTVINDIRAQSWVAVERLERLRCVALVATPLAVRGRAYGACCAAALEPSDRRFQPAQVQLFEAMARQVALAMEAADLYRHQKEEARISTALATEKSALLEVARDASGLDIASVLDRVHSHLTSMIPCAGVMTLAWEPASHEYRMIAERSADGAPGVATREFLAALPAAERFLSGGAVVINDVRKQRWLPSQTLAAVGIEALVIMPLLVQKGDLRGLCCIYARRGGASFAAAQVQLFEGVARHIALAMEAAGLYASQQEDAAVAAALAQFSQQMITSAPTSELLDHLCQLTTELLGCDASYTYQLDRATDEFVPVAHFGDEPEHWEALRVLRYPRPIMAELGEQLQRDGLADLLIEPPYEMIPSQIGELMRGMGFTRALFVPLQRGDGVFAVHHAIRRGHNEPFTRRQQRIMRGLAQVAPLALESARLFAELETANQVKEHFVATLTHELRNPIHAISGYHGLLLDKGSQFTSEQRDLIERAERCTMELNALIVATLDLSRFQAKRVKIDWQDLSVGELVAELSREIHVPADKRALELIWNPASGVGTLHTDPLKLKMALRNLVTNAVKFTERGHVCLDVYAQDGGVEFRVSDTGIGIPAKAQPALFEPFTQAHGIESRRKGGAGLGLHLVKRLVEILGGNVAVESQVGRGSTFRIWLPRDGRQNSGPGQMDHTSNADVAAPAIN